MLEHIQTHTFSKNVIEQVSNQLNMTGTKLYRKYGYKRDEHLLSITAKYEIGYQLDFVVVICEGDALPYIDLILFDENNMEVSCETSDAPLLGTHTIMYGDEKYSITIAVV